MGLSVFPTPADAGILCIILMNAATFISIVNGVVLFILQFLGINISKLQEDSIDSLSGSYESSRTPSSKSYNIEELRKRTTSAIRYDSVNKCSDDPEQECTVCLTKYEPDALIHLLSCGHVFHTSCLETWLKYWYVTCPLCRTRIIEPLRKEEEYVNSM